MFFYVSYGGINFFFRLQLINYVERNNGNKIKYIYGVNNRRIFP